jgi:uncharacterized protein (DUF305 family)
MKKLLFALALLSIATQLVQAQHQNHHQDHDKEKTINVKSIYLSMMDKMMVEMEKAPMGQNPETAFLQQMIPHHQGAVEMAEYEIAHGKDSEMIQLAKSILIEQKSEIEQMKRWLSESSLTHQVPDSYMSDMEKTMEIMMEAMPDESTRDNTDRSFAAVMKPHHQAAIDMAKVLLRYEKDSIVSTYAKLLISNQQIEINQMSNFLNSK